MKANELRIGNYVHYKNPDYENIPRIINYTQNPNLVGLENISVNRISYNQIEAIELTEEWLLRFGFEKWDNVTVNEYEYYERFVLYNVMGGTSNYEVHVIHSTYGNSKHKQIGYSIDNDERQHIDQTDYVHNLQNAFFLASSFELTLTK